jgi:hypothetical protein
MSHQVPSCQHSLLCVTWLPPLPVTHSGGVCGGAAWLAAVVEGGHPGAAAHVGHLHAGQPAGAGPPCGAGAGGQGADQPQEE